NAIFVEAASAGSLMFYGAGAGGVETSSAVLGDVVSAARRRISGGPGLRESIHADVAIADMGDIVTQYHISLDVSDQVGVLAGIARVFSDQGVSVLQIQQGIPDDAKSAASAADLQAAGDDEADDTSATLVIGTHRATERSLRAVVEALESLDAVQHVKGVLRVESAV
ncbi:MAG: ACT domain-containing protein, partial [Pseudoclavibacter sp.]